MNELSLFLFNKYHGCVRLCVASRIILRIETESTEEKIALAVQGFLFIRKSCSATHLMTTMMPSKMLQGFLMQPKGPQTNTFNSISRENRLVNTMLLISNALVSSSGFRHRDKERRVVSIYDTHNKCASFSARLTAL